LYQQCAAVVAAESEGKQAMSMSQRSRPASALRDSAPSGRTKKRSFWLAAVGGLLVLAIVAVAAFYALSGFFNANGTWYGPLHIKSGSTTVSIETYMDVSTSFTGSISGQGTFCIPLPFNNTSTFDYSLTGTRAFSRPGQDNQQPITLTAEYTVPIVLGVRLPIGPSLQMHGNATSSSFHLTGGDRNTSTSLDMQHGTKTTFRAACKALSPLG
jgi:hypothetical protein